MGLIKHYTSPGTIGDRRILTAEHTPSMAWRELEKKGEKKWKKKKGGSSQADLDKRRNRCLPRNGVFSHLETLEIGFTMPIN